MVKFLIALLLSIATLQSAAAQIPTFSTAVDDKTFTGYLYERVLISPSNPADSRTLPQVCGNYDLHKGLAEGVTTQHCITIALCSLVKQEGPWGPAMATRLCTPDLLTRAQQHLGIAHRRVGIPVGFNRTSASTGAEGKPTGQSARTMEQICVGELHGEKKIACDEYQRLSTELKNVVPLIPEWVWWALPIALVTIVIVIMLLSYYLYQNVKSKKRAKKESQELQQTITTVERERDEANTSRERAVNERQRLETTLASVIRERDNLTSQVGTLTSENERLTAQQQELGDLKIASKLLQEERNQNLEETGRLNRQVEQLQTALETTSAAVRRLEPVEVEFQKWCEHFGDRKLYKTLKRSAYERGSLRTKDGLIEIGLSDGDATVWLPPVHIVGSELNQGHATFVVRLPDGYECDHQVACMHWASSSQARKALDPQQEEMLVKLFPTAAAEAKAA